MKFGLRVVQAHVLATEHAASSISIGWALAWINAAATKHHFGVSWGEGESLVGFVKRSNFVVGPWRRTQLGATMMIGCPAACTGVMMHANWNSPSNKVKNPE